MLQIVDSECICTSDHSSMVSLTISLGVGSRKRGMSKRRTLASHTLSSTTMRNAGLQASSVWRQLRGRFGAAGSVKDSVAALVVIGGFRFFEVRAVLPIRRDRAPP